MEECKVFDIFCWLNWLVVEIKLVFVGIYSSILDSITGLLTSIPSPSFLLTPVPPMPASVIFYSDLFMIPYGLSAMVSAYLLRFIIRRLPIIG